MLACLDVWGLPFRPLHLLLVLVHNELATYHYVIVASKRVLPVRKD
jgi:hypothetical protein